MPPVHSLFVIVVALLLSYMNYRGLTVMGKSMMVSALVIVVPFLLLVLLSIPHIKPANWGEYKEEKVNWGTFINVMFWYVEGCGSCVRSVASTGVSVLIMSNTKP